MHEHAEHILKDGAPLLRMVVTLASLSLLSGVVGPYIQLTRSNAMVGSVSHALLLGVGLSALGLLNMYAALFSVALVCGLIVGWVKLKRPSQSDAITNIVWVAGMSIGILLLGNSETNTEEILHFLFGSLETVSSVDQRISLYTSLAVTTTVFIFHHFFLSVTIDPVGARVRGLPVTIVYLGLMALISISIVSLVKSIGIVLLIAFLTLPAAISIRLVLNFKRRMQVATGIALLASAFGLIVFNIFGVLPSASIALFLSFVYLMLVLLKPAKMGGYDE